MKLNNFYVFLIAVLFSSCMKDNLNNANNTELNKPTIEKLKNWYSTNLPDKLASRTKYQIRPQNVEWETTIYIPDEHVFISKVSDYLQDEDSLGPMKETYKLIVFYINPTGVIDSGRYYFIVPNVYEINLDNNEVWNKFVLPFHNNSIPLNLNATLFKYSLQGNKLFSMHIENGVISDSYDQIVCYDKAPLEGPVGQVTYSGTCTTYWEEETNHNGEIINIIYLGTYCNVTMDDPQGGGGGGGSTTTPSTVSCEDLCQMAFQKELSDGDVDNTLISRNVISSNSVLEKVELKWRCYSNKFYYLISIEDADLDKFLVFDPNSGNHYINKEFSSFEHRGMTAEGVNLGVYHRTYEDKGASITNARSQAHVSLTFELTTKFNCTLCTIGGILVGELEDITTYNPSKTFIANEINPVVQGN